MSDAVTLPTSILEDHEFIVDLARFAEGLLTEQQVRKKDRLANAVWKQLGTEDELVERIEAEKLRRIRDGSAARELAQKAFVAAPNVLSGILTDDGANPRHRIESAKELRQIATPPAEAAAEAASRFTILIDLSGDLGRRSGEDVHYFDKPRAVTADDDADPDRVDIAAIAAIAAKQKTDGGGG
jgi:hypothetical protein